MEPIYDVGEAPKESVSRIGRVLVTYGREALAWWPADNHVYITPDGGDHFVAGNSPNVRVEERDVREIMLEGFG